MYIIIDQIAENYPSSSPLDYNDKNIEQARNNKLLNTDNAQTEKLREDMKFLVRSHQHLNRSVKSCVKCFEYGILALSVLISMDTCSIFYFMLQAESSIIVMSYLLLCSTYTTVLLLVYYIGQRVTNQNDLFRRGLAKLQWLGKPTWFKQTLLIMIIKANTDIEIKPYSLYVLNLTSYKDIMKAAFTYGNIMYSRKST